MNGHTNTATKNLYLDVSLEKNHEQEVEIQPKDLFTGVQIDFITKTFIFGSCMVAHGTKVGDEHHTHICDGGGIKYVFTNPVHNA